jgi:hypothetical protein
MPLNFSGDSQTTPDGTTYRTIGNNGETVTVEASYEAIEDYGEPRVQAKANDKYDAGLVFDGKITIDPTDFSQDVL